MADDKRMGLYIPRRIVEDTQLSPSLRMVLAAMIEAADEDGICRIPARVIGARCGMTEGAANQGRHLLGKLGYIERAVKSPKKGCGSSNFRILRHGKEARHGGTGIRNDQ